MDLHKQPEDLDFADDISLLSRKHQAAQKKLCRVEEEAEKTGKTKVMKANNKNQDPVKLHHEEIEKVDKFVYLSSVSAKMGKQTDIKSRINKDVHVFNTLRQIWISKPLSVLNKIMIFNTNVKSVLLYGSETWRVTNTITTSCRPLRTDA